MIDNVIVTVTTENRGYSVDLELSAQLAVKNLAPKILEALEEIEPRQFTGLDNISLLYKGIPLSESSTLESEAVWDGSILTVR